MKKSLHVRTQLSWQRKQGPKHNTDISRRMGAKRTDADTVAGVTAAQDPVIRVYVICVTNLQLQPSSSMALQYAEFHTIDAFMGSP